MNSESQSRGDVGAAATHALWWRSLFADKARVCMRREYFVLKTCSILVTFQVYVRALPPCANAARARVANVVAAQA